MQAVVLVIDNLERFPTNADLSTYEKVEQELNNKRPLYNFSSWDFVDNSSRIFLPIGLVGYKLAHQDHTSDSISKWKRQIDWRIYNANHGLIMQNSES